MYFTFNSVCILFWYNSNVKFNFAQTLLGDTCIDRGKILLNVKMKSTKVQTLGVPDASGCLSIRIAHARVRLIDGLGNAVMFHSCRGL